jgi:hypothetical protein
VFTIQPDQIDAQWDHVAPFLEFGSLEWTPEHIRNELIAGRAQLWGLADCSGVHGVVITSIQTVPHTWGLIWIASGKGLHEGIEMLLEHIEPWLWAKGCHFIRVYGRKGWAMLPGYRETGREFTKVRQ